jgi:hypothetical protein
MLINIVDYFLWHIGILGAMIGLRDSMVVESLRNVEFKKKNMYHFISIMILFPSLFNGLPNQAFSV